MNTSNVISIIKRVLTLINRENRTPKIVGITNILF